MGGEGHQEHSTFILHVCGSLIDLSVRSFLFLMILLFLLVDMEDEDGTCLLDVLW